MASALFYYAKELFLGQASALDWDTNTIWMIFVDHADDTPVPATDQDLADIDAAARVDESDAFASKTVTSGVADAADKTISTVSGDEFESIVVFKETGTEADSWLIVYIDTGTGLPCTPNGGDITVQWDSGANKIFAL